MLTKWCVAIGCAVVVIALNYGMALLGEPRALWFFHNILGLI